MILNSTKLKTIILNYGNTSSNNDIVEHYQKYKDVLNELHGITINHKQVLINLLEVSPKTEHSLSKLIYCETRIHDNLIDLLKTGIDISNKLSIKTRVKSNFLAKDLEHIIDSGDLLLIKEDFLYHGIYNNNYLDTQSSDIAKNLNLNDISIITELIDLAKVSESLAFIASHHELISIIGLASFCQYYNTYVDSGKYLRVLSGIRYSLTQIKIFTQVYSTINSGYAKAVFLQIGSSITAYYILSNRPTAILNESKEALLAVAESLVNSIKIEGPLGNIIDFTTKGVTKLGGAVAGILRAAPKGFWIKLVVEPALEASKEVVKKK